MGHRVYVNYGHSEQIACYEYMEMNDDIQQGILVHERVQVRSV
ncbi:hypothetical protein GCM10010912_61860 [Paenibacillus albidus]|uniref:Uncharacterized protein n=1 Tax=Paenibacillus albidus TaxID=2041023 RepID=A0A917FWW2_9BACL|nr:hypothetical protein GCM10010912_61860 [Paenibacillus albidus]